MTDKMKTLREYNDEIKSQWEKSGLRCTGDSNECSEELVISYEDSKGNKAVECLKCTFTGVMLANEKPV